MIPIKAVLFDLDGLILDTEPLYDIIYQRFSEHMTGRRMDDKALHALKIKLFGRSLAETIGELCKLIGIRPVPIDSFREFQLPHLKELMPQAKLMKGAEQVIRYFDAAGAPMAVATSSPACYFDLKTANYRELFGLFRVVVTADDVKACKPEPDIFLEAAKRLGVPPKNCLVLEDAPSGIQAATRAGMVSVAVPPKGVPYELYYGKGATIIAPNLAWINPDEFLWDLAGKRSDAVDIRTDAF